MSDKLLAVKDNGLSGLAIQRIEAAEAREMIGVPDVDSTLAVSGAAADAKITGDAISLKSTGEESVIVKTANSAINYENGEIVSSSIYSISDKISIRFVSKIKYSRAVTDTSSSSASQIAFYSATDEYLGGIKPITGGSSKHYTDSTIDEIPNGADYCLICVFTRIAVGEAYIELTSKIGSAISDLQAYVQDTQEIIYQNEYINNWTPIEECRYASPSANDSDRTSINLTRVSSSQVQYGSLKCKSGDKFIITGRSGIGFLRAYIFGDNDGYTNSNDTNWCAPRNQRYNNYSLTAPEGATVLYVNRGPEEVEVNSYKIVTLKEYVDEQNTEINEGKILVSFGDSIFGSFRATSGANESISHMVEERTKITCLNCAFGATHAKQLSQTGRGVMDFEPLSEAIVSGDFSAQIAYAESRTDEPQYIVRVNELANIDFNTVDFITVSYGTNDWYSNVDKDAYREAIESSVRRISEAYPQIRFLICTPIIRFKNENDEIISTDDDRFVNSHGTKLSEFAEEAEKAAHNLHAQPCENYWTLGITIYNTGVYMGGYTRTDLVHPNAKGRRLIAHHVIQALDRM